MLKNKTHFAIKGSWSPAGGCLPGPSPCPPPSAPPEPDFFPNTSKNHTNVSYDNVKTIAKLNAHWVQVSDNKNHTLKSQII